MVNWLLALLGIAIYFMVRYANKKDTKNFSFVFWVKDNWPEFVISGLATIALMIVFMDPESKFDFSEIFSKVPYLVSLPATKVISLFVGYGNSALFYTLFRTKKK